MGDLSANFSHWEFQCKCCGRYEMAPALLAGLQRLRGLVDVPIHITSGFRCKKQNKKVDGMAASQHLHGRAADIVIEGFTSAEAFVVAETMPEFRSGGMGVYPEEGHLHVDVRGYRARWGFNKLPRKKEGGV